MKHYLLISLTAIYAAAGVQLAAQDFYGAGVTADTNRRAGIFSTTSRNPVDALALNPAGLTALSAPTISASATGIFARGSFSNFANAASPMAPNYGFVPSAGFGTPLGKHWAIGVAVTPDLLSVSKWNYSDTPGFAGATYGRQAEKSAIIAIRSAMGVAYRFSEKVSVGATAGLDYNSNTLDAPYIFQSHPLLAGLKTLLDLHTTGYGWNTSFGITTTPFNHLEVGFSFRTGTSITSHGRATGNMGVEFQSLGLAAQPDFAYRAQVQVHLPPTAILSTGWQFSRTTRFSFQTDWIGWHGAFENLPVTLTGGTNEDINSLLQSSSLKDSVPLRWKDQITYRGGIERTISEKLIIGGGFLHGNSPVPISTLSPLTAAIMQNAITTGAGWELQRLHFAAAYCYNLTAHGDVIGSSALLYGEYTNSRTRIGTQAFTLSVSFPL